MNLNLHGAINNMVFDEIEIIVGSTDKAAIAEFKKLLRQYPQGSKVEKIEEEKYESPITIGFEINERYNTSSLKSVQHALRKMEKEITNLTRQKNRLEKDNRYIEQSTSWKYTEPLRKAKRLLNKS